MSIRKRVVGMILRREGVLGAFTPNTEHQVRVKLTESRSDWLAHGQVCRLGGHGEFQGKRVVGRSEQWFIRDLEVPLFLGELHCWPTVGRVHNYLGLRSLRG